MSQNVLVVEDEERMREFIGVYFRAEGFQVLEAKNGMKAIDIFNKNKIDLVILDVMMPELDGFQVCRRLRENSSVPIIILTAVVGEDEQLMGYELGADDYMTKPFKGKILVAKAKRVMDRVYSEEGKNTLIFEGINIDLDSRLIKIDSKIIEFAPKEFELLIYLAQNQGIIKTREQILNKIWGYDYFGDDRVVDNHIKKVRKKLKGYAQYIKTVITVGYKFEV